MGTFTPNGLYKPDSGEGGIAALLNANWDLLDPVISGGGGGGAPTTASYITLAAEAGLSNETVLGTGIMMSGLLAARPASSALSGRFYWATDVNGGTLYRDNGSTWDRIAPSVLLTIDQDISPAQLTADQNDYAPTGIATASILRLDANANRTITGIAGGWDGRVLILKNITAIRTLTLANESASSTAANRLSTGFGGQDFTLQPGGQVILIYDSTAQRWAPLVERGFGAAITSVGSAANNSGISPNLTRDDHVHQHATIASGDHHTEYLTEATVTTKGDILVATGSGVIVRRGVGTNGQVLTADSAQADGVKWATPSGGGAVATDAIWDTKGDLAAATGADAAVKVPAGTNGYALTADSSQTAGVAYKMNPVILTAFMAGVLTTGVGKFFVYNDTGMNLTIVAIRLRVNTAPTGATLIIDVNKSGTTIYTTQGNRPTIAISGTTIKSTNPDVTTLADGENLSFDIDQIGSTIAGSDLSVTVLCRVA